MAHLFDHERLDVYQLELKFIAWVTPLLAEVRGQNASALVHEACDHLDRGSLSALFNTAEGNGKRQQQVRARYFDDARGSATECAACLDALVAKGASTTERVLEGKEMLHRIVSMLTRLVQRYTNEGTVQEMEEEYSAERGGKIDDEHEDDDEDARP